ncbi:hypothetical protein [Ruegeria sp.]|uniref:hypothetical protein n=1 Tax=Ruegeria sp. TaxID=1879320 RepID=UPI003AFFF202
MIEPREQIEARLDAEWEEKGLSIVARERAFDRGLDGIAWEMGDWVAERPTAYGDMTRLAEKLDVPLGTLKNRASVARRIEPSRRRDELSWSHHAEVAGLEPEEGDAVLAEASLYNWSVDRLRGVMAERSARGRAERENARLKAEIEALKAERAGPDAARRVVDGVRADIEAGLDMVEEGYRRILAATESEDLAVAVASLHGNARRRLAPSLEALIGRALEERVTKLAGKVSASLTRLATDANRHDAMTIDDATPEQTGPLPAGISGHSP